MSDRVAQTEARRYGQAAGLLSIGVGFAGALIYLYFALASHTLSKVEYGEIVVLWSAVFVVISTVFRPIEQLLTRTIAERDALGHPAGRPLRVAATIQLCLAALFTALAFALRGPVQDELFSSRELLFWVLVAAVLGYSASYFARGFLAGKRRFTAYAALLIAEAVARVAAALLAALGIANGQDPIAVGIAVAPFFSLLVIPFATGRRTPQSGSSPASTPSSEAEFTLAHGGRFAAGVLLIMISEQTFLNAGPLLIRASEGAAEAGFIFNVLMVARAPLVMFLAIATSLLPHLTRLWSGGTGGDQAFRLSVRVTLTAIAAFTVAVAVIVLAVGPQLMQIAFGSKFDYDRAGLLIVALGMGSYLSASTLNQAALAQGQVTRAALRYLACALAFLAFNLSGLVSDIRAVEIGFAGAAALLCALLYRLYRQPADRPADPIAPDSPEEIEARLAAADEAT